MHVQLNRNAQIACKTCKHVNVYSQIRNMKIKQIYSRNTDQEGWEGGQLAKTEVRTRMWFTCNI